MGSPAFSDARQQDVAAVRAALDGVATSGKTAKIGVVAAAELYALGALTHPLIDADALAWWNAQADHEAVSRAAYGDLVKRTLIDPETGRLCPPLGLVLAGRSRPAFIVLSRENPVAQPTRLHLYGIAEDPGVLRAVLVEAALPTSLGWAGPAYEYALVGTAQAGRELAEWAAAGKRRTLDLYRPGQGTDLASERIVVTRGRHHKLRVELQTPDGATSESLPCDVAALSGVLTALMMGASQ